MSHRNINLRVPVELVERIDAAVIAEAARTGLRIDRSQIIRQALAKVLPDLKKKAARKTEAA